MGKNKRVNFKSQRKASDLGRFFSSGVRVGKVPYGFGVFAYAFIPKGTPLGRVQGTIIADADYGSDYCISAGDGKVLEPGPPFCYLNHSCEPNCQLMQYVREQDETLEVGELLETDLDLDGEEEDEAMTGEESFDDDCFYGDGGAAEIESEDENKNKTETFSAIKRDEEDEMHFEEDEDSEIWVEVIRDILPGDELTIDYAWPADRAAKCLCGSPACRGWIVDPNELELLQK
jgi:hypothetical protein